MQHIAHAAPKPVAHICTHPMLANGGPGAPPPLQPRNMPHIPPKAAHMNANATITHQPNHLPPYQPHQTSIQMQKIRQQHQHINYKNNNNNNNNNNNCINNNNNHINKNANYNTYNNLNNNNNLNNHQINQIAVQQHHPKHLLTRNVNLQHQQQQLPTVATNIKTVPPPPPPPLQQQQYNNMTHNENQVMHQIQPEQPNATTMMNYQQKSAPFHVMNNHNKIKYNNNKFSTLHKPYISNDVYNNNNNGKLNQQQTYRNGGKFMRQSQQQQQQPQARVQILAKPNKEDVNNENNKKVEENINEQEIKSNDEEKQPETDTTTSTTTTNLSEKETTVEEEEEVDSSVGKKESNVGDNNNNNILSNEDESAAKNGKEKTPMCLVNELARFNKITHQYRLTSEKGPAHCKSFTVTLKLGEEEYSADGFKIKKAQHMAAAQAIEKTKYKHPVPKTLRRNEESSSTRSYITPTVELNALAMKLGQQTYYLFDPRQMPHPAQPANPNMHGNMNDMVHEVNSSIVPNLHPAHFGNHQHAVIPHGTTYIRRPGAGFVPAPAPFLPPFQPRFGYGRGYMQKYAPRFQPPPMPPHASIPPQIPMGAQAHFHPSIYDGGLMGMGPCKITLIVGTDKFVGTGRTLQQAKHDAAAQALQVLKAQQASQQEEALNSTQEESDDKKSPISLVHEIGIKRDLAVRFKVLREEGPAHMRKFITACMVGSIVTEGDGNGKKISKKRAAEKMLVELKKLPPLSPPKSPTRRIKVKTPGKFSLGAIAITTPKSEKRKRVFVKDKSADSSIVEEENPVTKLLQVQQARKAAEPVFEIIAKNGSEFARRKEFIVEVSFMNMVARGTGINKKIAKKNAAQNMLDLLTDVNAEDKEDTLKVIGVEQNNKKQEELSNKENEEKDNNLEATTTTKTDAFNLPMVETTAGQIPGILILRPNKKNHLKKKTSINSLNNSQESATTTTNNSGSNDKVPYKTTTATTDETTTTTVIETTSTTATTTTTVADNNATTKTVGGKSIMKDQLLYLSKLMGFEVCFNDYPKGGSHSDFLTIVTLSTDPPQICHGTGSNSEESQNDAARNALKILSELGLSSAKK